MARRPILNFIVSAAALSGASTLALAQGGSANPSLGLSIAVPSARPESVPQPAEPISVPGPRAAVADAEEPARPDDLPVVEPRTAEDVVPSEPGIPQTAERPDPEDRAEETGGPTPVPVRLRLKESDRAFRACTSELSDLGVQFQEVDPVRDESDRDCGIERPIAVTQIAPGIELRPISPMRCETAQATARWVKEDVIPAVAKLPDAKALSAVNHASTYVCRRRNNRPTGKPSEHSFGNAIDIISFEFENAAPIKVEPRETGGPRADFQSTVRKASCDHFTTVIGPGTNAAHADHLHLDVIERPSGYRLCE